MGGLINTPLHPHHIPTKYVQQSACTDTGIEQPGEVKSNGSPGQANGWSSDQESDSDDSLQPFDLAEEDDEGEHHMSTEEYGMLQQSCDTMQESFAVRRELL